MCVADKAVLGCTMVWYGLPVVCVSRYLHPCPFGVAVFKVTGCYR
jgi:hypothetical protein